MNSGRQTLESMSQAIWYNRWTLKKFTPYLRGDILEVGCGIGNFTSILLEYGQVWAIDINKDYLAKLKRKVFGLARIGFGDIEKGRYFFGRKSFDCIVCLNVLEHIKEDDQAFLNISRLLKEGGYLVLLVPAHQFLYGAIDKAIGHYRRYQRGQLLKLLSNHNFKVLICKEINFLGALGWWFSGKIFKSVTVREGSLKIFNWLAPILLPVEDRIKAPVGTSILVVAQKGFE